MKSLIFIILLLFGCGKELEFSDYYAATIPAWFGQLDIEYPYESVIAQDELEGEDTSKINSIRLTDFMLSISNPPEQNLDFISSMKFYIGEGKSLMASGENFGAGCIETELKIEDLNIKDYIINSPTLITVEIHGVWPQISTTIRIDYTAIIHAGN